MSNCFGARNLPLAERFFKVICISTVVAMLVISVTLQVTKTALVAFFTSDATVQEITLGSIKLVSIFCIFDGL